MTSLFRNFIAGLSERERRLVIVVSAVFVVFVVFLVAFFVGSAVSGLGKENRARLDTLRLIELKGQEYLDLQRENSLTKSRTAAKPTPLRTMIDKIGNKVGVTVPDMKELPDQRHGDKWIEHSVELSLQQVELTSLTRFMEEVEGNRRKFPVAINKLEVRKRRRTEDAYDVKMVISTYERSAKEETDDKKKSGTAAEKDRT